MQIAFIVLALNKLSLQKLKNVHATAKVFNVFRRNYK